MLADHISGLVFRRLPAPLAGWQLPQELVRLRRLLEARLGKPGKREYVQVLRLLEDFPLNDVAAAARQAVELGTIGFDAVKPTSTFCARNPSSPG